MLSRLDAKYDVQFEVISHPREYFKTEAWQQGKMPAAPAIVIDDEVITVGKDIKEELLEAAICRHLGLSVPSKGEGGFWARYLGKK